MEKKNRLFQVIMESLIPLIGYFYWEWNAFFIASFYVLEFAVNQCLFYLKYKKIKDYLGEEIKSLPGVLLFLILSFIIIAQLGLIFSFNLIDKKSFMNELQNFLFTKELGMPQVVLLLPLLVLAGYMQYKFEFIKMKRFIVASSQKIFKTHVVSLLVVLAVLIVLTGFSFLVELNQLLVIVMWVLVSAAYSFLFKMR